MNTSSHGEVLFEAKYLRDLTASEHSQLLPLTLGGANSYMLAALRDHPEFARCFLAITEGRIVGWSLARWFKRFEDRPRNAHLSVFVAPEWRRRGLGRDLLSQAMAFCREHGLTPWVYGETPSQLNFYKACRAEDHISMLPFQTS
jgi:GNAT superfamily N-acetyltransferase